MNKSLILALIVSISFSILFSYLSYSFYGSKVKAEQALSLSENVRISLAEAQEKKEKSCLIDTTSVVEVEEEKKELLTKVDSLTKQIDDLRKKGPLIKKPTITQEPLNEKPTVLSGDDVFSDDLIRLLDEAFCLAEPTDNQCLSP